MKGTRSLVRTQLAVIVGVTAVLLLSALSFQANRHKQFTSVATVLVGPQVLSNGNVVPPDMGTEKQVALSRAVADLSSQRLPSSVGNPDARLSVSVPVDTHVLVFSVSASHAVAARDRARALSEAYTTFRNRKTEVAPGTGTAPVGPPAPDVTVISAATLPAAPAGRNTTVVVVAAVLLGLALGLGTALARDRVSDRLRGAPDLEALLDRPVLAELPALGRRRRGGLVLPDDRSPLAAGFRYLRARLLPGVTEGGAVVVITSGAGHDGKTWASVNLAVAFARSGRRTVLLQADGRLSDLPALLGTHPADPLGGELAAGRLTGVPGLVLLQLGDDDRWEPADAVEAAARGADVVIIDAPAVPRAADTIALVACADQVLLVADATRSTRREVRLAASELQYVSDRFVGSVLVDVNRGWGRWRASGQAALLRQEPLAAVIPSAKQPLPVGNRSRS